MKKLLVWFLRRFAYVREIEESFRDAIAVQAGEVTLRDVAVKRGLLSVEFGTELSSIMAGAFLKCCDHYGAENYVEYVFGTKDGPLCVVAIRRKDGKTPGEVASEARAERDYYGRELERLRNAIECLQDKEYDDSVDDESGRLGSTAWCLSMCRANADLGTRCVELIGENDRLVEELEKLKEPKA